MFDNVDVGIRKKQGNVGVARAIYEYTRMGYTVLAPLSDSDKYDLVIDTGTDLFRVQVKTSRQRQKGGEGRTGFVVQLATHGGNTQKNTIRKRSDDDYDVLFVLLETGDCYSIPVLELQARNKLALGSSQCKYQSYRL